jgi:hypothetical protein
MTDTPDALINHLLDVVEHGGDFTAANFALRARLTAGDAAIKRVAELTQQMNTMTTTYVAGLAAARGEIERKDAALLAGSVAFRWYEQIHASKTPPDTDKAARNREFAVMLETALAPKETNNG